MVQDILLILSAGGRILLEMALAGLVVVVVFAVVVTLTERRR